jgi:hypothetical protein
MNDNRELREMMGRVAETLSALRVLIVIHLSGVEVTAAAIEAAIGQEISPGPMREAIAAAIDALVDDVAALQSRFAEE